MCHMEHPTRAAVLEDSMCMCILLLRKQACEGCRSHGKWQRSGSSSKSLNFEIDKMTGKKDGLRVETGLPPSLPPPSAPELPPPVSSILGEAPPVLNSPPGKPLIPLSGTLILSRHGNQRLGQPTHHLSLPRPSDICLTRSG